MAINLGALELSISASGTTTALRDIARVDAAASGTAKRAVADINAIGTAAVKTGKRRVDVPIRATGAEQAAAALRALDGVLSKVEARAAAGRLGRMNGPLTSELATARKQIAAAMKDLDLTDPAAVAQLDALIMRARELGKAAGACGSELKRWATLQETLAASSRAATAGTDAAAASAGRAAAAASAAATGATAIGTAATGAATRLQGLALAFSNMTRAGAMGGLDAMASRITMFSEGLKHASTRSASAVRLTQIEASLTKALAAGNLTLSQRIALESRLGQVRSAIAARPAPGAAGVVPAAGRGAGLMGMMGGLRGIAAGLGIGVGIGAVTAGFQRMSAAMDATDNAARMLNATSKITGLSLDDVQQMAGQAADKFGMSQARAAEMTSSFVRFTAVAGQVNQTGDFMTAWMDLAAARGLGAAEAMQALETTLVGQDEGLNRLGLSNPQQIYEKWAGAIGVTASKMDQAQKNQAVMMEVMSVGGLVAGQFAERMDSAAGASDRQAQASERMWEALGRALLPMRELVYDIGIGFSEWVIENQGTIAALGAVLTGVLAPAFSIVGDSLMTVIDIVRGAWGYLVGGILTGVERIMSGVASMAGGIASLAGRIGLTDYAARLGGEVAGLRAQAASVGTMAASNLAMGRSADAALQKRMGQFKNARGASSTTTTRAGTTTTGAGAGSGRTTTGAGAGGAAGPAPVTTSIGNVVGGLTPTTLARVTPLNSNAAAGVGVPGSSVGADAMASMRNYLADAARWDEARDVLANGIAAALTAGITSGFEQAFASGSIGEGFAALSGALLGGLGDAMMQFGAATLISATLMEKIKAALASFLPGGAITASLAMIAIGAALKAAGGAAGKAFGGKGGRGGGAGGGPAAFGDRTGSVAIGSGQTASVREGAAAKASPNGALVVNATIIGPDDPKAQRGVVELINNAHRRNLG